MTFFCLWPCHVPYLRQTWCKPYRTSREWEIFHSIFLTSYASVKSEISNLCIKIARKMGAKSVSAEAVSAIKSGSIKEKRAFISKHFIKWNKFNFISFFNAFLVSAIILLCTTFGFLVSGNVSRLNQIYKCTFYICKMPYLRKSGNKLTDAQFKCWSSSIL